jgi:hypothetical protein
MTAPHLASDNSRIAVAERNKLANAERHLRAMVDALVREPPLDDHLNRLVDAARAHQQLRIRDQFAGLRDAEAVRVVR